MNKNWYSMKAQAGKTGEIYIYDTIADSKWDDSDPCVSARSFIADLKSLGDIDTIELHINSPGGSVFAASAILAALQRHPARVEVYIDGIAASAASVVAMAGYVRMPENALLMIHNPSSFAWGTAADLRKTAEALDKSREGLVSVYKAKSGLPETEIVQMLDAETWMTAAEAVSRGFADEATPPVQMAAFAGLDLSGFRNVPEAVVNAIAPDHGAKPKESKMNLQELKEKHPGLVDEIRNEAAHGMVDAEAARTGKEAAAAEARAAVLALAAAVLPEASAKRLQEIAESGVTPQQAAALGVRIEATSPVPQQMLEAITNAAPAGVRPARPEPVADKGIDTSAIYARRREAIAGKKS